MQELNSGPPITDWDDILIQALHQLGAEQTLTRGAILRQRMDELANQRGKNLRDFLQETGQRFVNLVDKNPRVVVFRRPGADMYVGLEGASWPAVDAEEARRFRGSGLRLRPDVYNALTRITDRLYYYVPSRDQFTQATSDEEQAERIALPQVTLSSLLDQRRRFASQRPADESKEELLAAIDHSPNPLAEFQAKVIRQRLASVWHEFNVNNLKKQLEDWAVAHDIEVSPSWIRDESPGQAQDTSQRLLARFSGYMTDEEVRSTMVPFRAVEAMYKDLGGPQYR